MIYVNAPIGAGQRVPGPVKPHIACPTTSGTGSETTGIAIFNLQAINAKTGIISRRLIPRWH
jgi:alcohol dehydrogenase class IV